jgi:hypothetical protein
MNDFLQTLKDAFPVLKSHPVAMTRLVLIVSALITAYKLKELRKRICDPLLTRLNQRIDNTRRWLYVYHVSRYDQKYYTSGTTGNGDTGDDMVWTLVSWPDLKPKDVFVLSGAVGMVNAMHESQIKLRGRWDIVYNADCKPIGPLPARGLKGKLRRICAKVLQLLVI